MLWPKDEKGMLVPPPGEDMPEPKAPETPKERHARLHRQHGFSEREIARFWQAERHLWEPEE